ncbi:MAG TPA: asparagine synthase (glutamine-hydrolyzing) [Byssovorax sp.]
MCGIAGIYDGHEPAPRQLLCAMGGEIAHRGPDGTGLYLDGRFGMVNMRLAIVDIAGGDQPIANADRKLWVMQNGEIYNAPELRAELEALGHAFTSRSDTEVIVHAYEAWGERCLDKLNGEFAFAIWDRERRELFLARDRFGIRPLFVAWFGATLVFASEVKAILRHPRASRALDPVALHETLHLWQTLPDRTAFVGVRELAPGSLMRVGPSGVIEERRWWDLRYAARDEPTASAAARLADEVLEKLTEATRIRLRADVPVGVYLSGGLDSSATAALVRRLTSQPVKAFSLAFEDPVYDERAFQKQMASALGVDLVSIDVRARDVADVFPDVVRAWEKPTLRTSPAPLMLLSRAVRASGYKVVLTGEGADEIFAGYDVFKEDKIRRFWAKQPASKARPRLFGRLHQYVARDLSRTAALLYGRGLDETQDPLYSHRLRFEGGARSVRLFSASTLEASVAAGDPAARLVAMLTPEFHAMSALSRAQVLEQKTFMEGFLLHAQGDRMLMSSSVEGRFPFLDVDVVEHAAQIPDALRMLGLREKHILRKAVGPLLPELIAKRPKHPYRAPILQAFVGEGRPEYVDACLSEARVTEAGVLDAGAVSRLVARCEKGAATGVTERDEMALTFALSTMLLHEAFVRAPTLAPPATPTRFVEGDQCDSAAGRERAS